jgi:glycosyltransferase involved in cell wall biosynthesis
VFIGRFSREKGAGDLVQAAALLAGHGVRLRIAMVGAFDSQHDEGWLRGLLRLHQVDDLFIWHTHHPHPTEIIRQSRVLALPSYREGFGRVLLEAMACRVPVVATPVGGVPEVVRANETGVIVPVGDIEALAGGLNSLTQNRTLNEKMGEAGFASVRDHFSENRFAERLAELYDGVLI